MARKQNPKVEEAYKLYETGMKLVEIARELDVPEGTIRRWKSTYGWGRCSKSERPDKKAGARKGKNGRQEKDAGTGDKEPPQNSGLTDKQQLFCCLYVKCFNATKAYQKAYGCSYGTAMAEGSKALRNPKIKPEIERLKQDRLNRELLSEEDIFQKYIDIAFADITDYVSLGKYGEIKMKDLAEIDGTIVAEVKQGRNGTSIKLADRMRALQWLSEHMEAEQGTDSPVSLSDIIMAAYQKRKGQSDGNE